MELAAAATPPLAVAADYGPLPLDVLHDILLRLPADEVCRLRPVCRTWQSLTSDPLFTRAHAALHPDPHLIVVRRHGDGDEGGAEVHAVDLQGNVTKRTQIRQPIGPVSMHGDRLCASHGWGLTSVVDMVTGAAADVSVDRRKKVNSATPYCVLGQVPATGEYKVLRVQADYLGRRRRQACEVMTLGGGAGAGMWRRRACPPFILRIKPWCSSSWTVAVVAGHVYFLVHELSVEPDRLAVFDLKTEEWKPATLQGPLTTSLLAGDELFEQLITMPHLFPLQDRPLVFLRRNHFQLARLGESLVVVYCNVKNGWTELWFLEDMEEEDTMTARWSKRYTLQGTAFGSDYFSPLYHYPLAVLDDGRILVWALDDVTSAMRAYDPETGLWTDLGTLTADCVVGMHHGSLVSSSNVGTAVQDSRVMKPRDSSRSCSHILDHKTTRWPGNCLVTDVYIYVFCLLALCILVSFTFSYFRL